MEKLYYPSGKTYLYVNEDKELKIDTEYISYLKYLAQKNKDGRCTMCLHNDTREHMHEMINVYPEKCYVRPHSHPFKVETKTIIEGKLLIIIFDNMGRISDKFVMEKNGVFMYRIDKGIIHTNIPLTDVVFHEAISGPFIGKDDSIFPKWAPELCDEEKVDSYITELLKASNKQNSYGVEIK